MSFIKKYKCQIALTITFVIGMIFASFFDLQISKAIADLKPGKYYSENIIGLFFESFGVNPVYLLVAFASSVIYQNFNRRQNSKLRIIIMFLCVITSIVMFALMFKKTFKYIGEHYGFVNQLGGFWDTVAYGLFGVILTFVLILLTKKLPNSFLNKALCWAVIIMLTAGLSEAVTHIIKPFAGRARYRTLNVLNNFDLYTPWYVFNGKVSPDELMLTLGVASDGFKSFPSGHSSSVAMLIVLTALPKLIPSLNTKGKKTILYLAVFLGIFAVTFSRILVGAHYLSDVLVGTFITLLCYFVVDLVMNKIFAKYLKLQPLNEKVRIIRLQEENI